MRLGALIAAGASPDGSVRIPAGVDVGSIEVIDLTNDSRQVLSGWVFCAVSGAVADGHRYASEAVGRGAVAVVVEHPVDLGVPEIIVPSTRAAMGPLAAALHGVPSRAMTVVAVTGTNGKTTTCHLIAHILEALGQRCGMIGTLSGERTTPEAPALQRQLARLRDAGHQAVAMEATSIGLDLHRVDGTEFALSVFTNLSRDHLDYHQDMGRYFAAKARLFEPALSARAVVNADDPYGRLLLDTARVPMSTFSFDDVYDLVLEPQRSRWRWRGVMASLPIGGRFNVANALAALTAVIDLGVSVTDAVEALAAVPPVPGRFEPIERGQPFTVVVDYAHTPDGLSEVLTAARQLTNGQVLVVFGCGGDRDPTKRAPMGETAARLADVVLVTSDNPRREDPDAIISAVRSGIPTTTSARVVVEPDRRSAIATAFALARTGDVVVIAGKGHETTQTIGETVVAFDDRVVAAELLEQLS